MARVNPEAVYDTRGGHIPALPKDRAAASHFASISRLPV